MVKNKLEPKKNPLSPFRDGDEYFEFGVKHHVWGQQARDLKKKLDKQTDIPLPKLSLPKKH